MGFFTVLTALLVIATFHPTVAKDEDKWLSPEYRFFFQLPLPIPPVIHPIESYTNTSTGTEIDFFQLNITAFEKQIYPGLAKAHLVGYNGMSPGPTFRITRGRQSVVRVINEYAVHLHGSYTRPVWDGWAEDVILPGQYKDYYYPNSNVARTMWYHGITALNAYSGQAGFYIVEDPEVEARLGLPQGEYDIPLALAAKQYTNNGDLTAVADERDSLYGDVIEVNGQPWPYLNVEPRKYRFRVLNTALSRTFMLSIASGNNAKNLIPFTVVASDSGFMSSAVTTSKLTVAMAERWEIIVDFSGYSGQNLIMNNDRKVFVDNDFAGTGKVMQFNVGSKVSSDANNGPVKASLVSLDVPQIGSEVDRKFKFEKSHGEFLINGVGFADIQNRIVANPPRGRTEVWSLENHSGSWSHPIHIHMVDFQILSRVKGRKTVEPYEMAALKDVAVLGPDERITVAVKFAPMEGLYMFHCHNLVHEDHDMMAAFNVSSLGDFGYHESDLTFTDPLDKEWAAKPFQNVDIQSIKEEVLPRFAATKAYQNITGIEKALDDYWVIHKEGSSSAPNHGLYQLRWIVSLLTALLCTISL